LRVQLAPDLLGAEDLLEVTLLLPLRAVGDQRRPADGNPKPIDRARGANPRHFLGDDRLLHRPRVLTAVLPRPTHPHVPGLPHLAVPGAALLEVLERFARHVRLEPGAN